MSFTKRELESLDKIGPTNPHYTVQDIEHIIQTKKFTTPEELYKHLETKGIKDPKTLVYRIAKITNNNKLITFLKKSPDLQDQDP